MAVDFTIITSTGEIFHGQIKGYGGLVGGGYAYLGEKEENRIALEGMRNTIEKLSSTNKWMSEAAESTDHRGHCELMPIFKISNSMGPDERQASMKIVDLRNATIHIFNS